MRRLGFPLLLIFAVAFMTSCDRQKEVPRSANLTALAKEFVASLAKEEFPDAAGSFDSVMKKALPSEKLREGWKSLVAQAGPFQRQVGVRTERMGEYAAVFVICEFEKAAVDIKVVFNSASQITGLWFLPGKPATEYEPPAYARPHTFREREIRVGAGEWALPGTLSLPMGEGPFPVVVLVHGSGPHDRDESIGPNKPFRDLAWGLASRGIAVLRYEKRTKEHVAKVLSIKEGLTVKEETIDDALSAVAVLKKTRETDAQKIFVLGHSLGGMLIPRIAARDPGVAGFIVMAGTARPLEDVILDQTSYLVSLDGTISESEKRHLEQVKVQVARVKDPKLSVVVASADRLLGASCKYWLDLRGYNPPKAAESVKQPMLILHGESDYQVTREDFQLWKKSLSGRANVEFKVYPKLNHLFIEGQGKSTPAEYQRAGHVAKIVIDDIANWIKRQ